MYFCLTNLLKSVISNIACSDKSTAKRIMPYGVIRCFYYGGDYKNAKNKISGSRFRSVDVLHNGVRYGGV